MSSCQLIVDDREQNLISSLVELGVSHCVEHLDVSGNLLSALPACIATLIQLRSLRISYNCIYALPPGLGIIRNLVLLDCVGNETMASPPQTLVKAQSKGGMHATHPMFWTFTMIIDPMMDRAMPPKPPPANAKKPMEANITARHERKLTISKHWSLKPK